jgi:hypothetical protein
VSLNSVIREDGRVENSRDLRAEPSERAFLGLITGTAPTLSRHSEPDWNYGAFAAERSTQSIDALRLT